MLQDPIQGHLGVDSLFIPSLDAIHWNDTESATPEAAFHEKMSHDT